MKSAALYAPIHADAEQAQRAETNRLLRSIPPHEYERLLADLEPMQYPVRHLVWEADAPIVDVLFPRTSVASLIARLSDGGAVETATVGREGHTGSPIVLGSQSTGVRCIIQVPGEALRIPVEVLRARLTELPAFAALLLRYAQTLWEQTSQSVACNRLHSIEERCARWLLMTHDRVGRDDFLLTQDFLAQMLGVRRPSVTVAAGMLQRAGMIRYSRGRVLVLDRARLEEASCECFHRVAEKYDALLGPDALRVPDESRAPAHA